MHLQQSGFAENLAGILARYPHVAPQRLDLEILETAALSELDKACSIIRDCESLGVTFLWMILARVTLRFHTLSSYRLKP